MTTEPQIVEVEVIEIDDIIPADKPEPQEKSASTRRSIDWQKWLVRIQRLDRRWWPVWIFLGSIALVLLLTVGVVVGILFVIYQMILGFFRAFFHPRN